MTAPGALTAQDVAAVREEAAAGKAVTVWFTAAAVGVPAGGSAKVLEVGDVADGDFIRIRPGGSKDTMYCSPNELTRTRPPRRRAGEKVAEPASHAATPTRRPAPARARVAAPPVAAPPVAAPPASQSPSPPARTAAAPPSAAIRTAAAPPTAASPAAAPPAAARPAAAPSAATPQAPAARPQSSGSPAAGRRRVQRSGEITISLAATADGEWSVEVLAGTKRVVPRTRLPAADVAAAARSLPPAVVEVVESSLEGARQRQRERVESLRAELDAAQRALEQLGS